MKGSPYAERKLRLPVLACPTTDRHCLFPHNGARVPASYAQKPASFEAASTVAGGSIPGGAYKAFTGYFNRDGRLDVEFSGETYIVPTDVNYVQVALNKGGGTFSTVNSNAGRAIDALTGADAGADLDGDGLTDVLTIVEGQIKSSSATATVRSQTGPI